MISSKSEFLEKLISFLPLDKVVNFSTYAAEYKYNQHEINATQIQAVKWLHNQHLTSYTFMMTSTVIIFTSVGSMMVKFGQNDDIKWLLQEATKRLRPKGPVIVNDETEKFKFIEARVENGITLNPSLKIADIVADYPAMLLLMRNEIEDLPLIAREFLGSSLNYSKETLTDQGTQNRISSLANITNSSAIKQMRRSGLYFDDKMDSNHQFSVSTEIEEMVASLDTFNQQIMQTSHTENSNSGFEQSPPKQIIEPSDKETKTNADHQISNLTQVNCYSQNELKRLQSIEAHLTKNYDFVPEIPQNNNNPVHRLTQVEKYLIKHKNFNSEPSLDKNSRLESIERFLNSGNGNLLDKKYIPAAPIPPPPPDMKIDKGKPAKKLLTASDQVQNQLMNSIKAGIKLRKISEEPANNDTIPKVVVDDVVERHLLILEILSYLETPGGNLDDLLERAIITTATIRGFIFILVHRGWVTAYRIKVKLPNSLIAHSNQKLLPCAVFPGKEWIKAIELQDIDREELKDIGEFCGTAHLYRFDTRMQQHVLDEIVLCKTNSFPPPIVAFNIPEPNQDDLQGRKAWEKWHELKLQHEQSDSVQFALIYNKLVINLETLTGIFMQLLTTIGQIRELNEKLSSSFEGMSLSQLREFVKSIPAQKKEVVKKIYDLHGLIVKEDDLKLTPEFIAYINNNNNSSRTDENDKCVKEKHRNSEVKSPENPTLPIWQSLIYRQRSQDAKKKRNSMMW